MKKYEVIKLNDIREKVLQKRKEGMFCIDIAKELNISLHTLFKIIKPGM
jgi:orotate phosphoribosyltransferase-like protein